MTLRDMAIECLERSGVADARRKSSDDLFTMLMQRQFYNPTAAFPAILDNAINKSYVEGHRKAPVTFDRWTKRAALRTSRFTTTTIWLAPSVTSSKCRRAVS